MKPRTAIILAILALVATGADAQSLPASSAGTATIPLDLRIRNGRVTLIAHDVTTRQILEEWARLGGTIIVNHDRIAPARVTLQLADVSERVALDILLRDVSGYIAVARTRPGGRSTLDRILILPTSAAAAPPPRPADTAPRATVERPFQTETAARIAPSAENRGVAPTGEAAGVPPSGALSVSQPAAAALSGQEMQAPANPFGIRVTSKEAGASISSPAPAPSPTRSPTINPFENPFAEHSSSRGRPVPPPPTPAEGGTTQR